MNCVSAAKDANDDVLLTDADEEGFGNQVGFMNAFNEKLS